MILESSEASIAAVAYDTLTHYFESKLPISSLEDSPKSKSFAEPSSTIEDPQERRAPIIKQKSVNSVSTALNTSTHNCSPDKVDLYTSDYMKALLERETIKLKAIQNKAKHLLSHTLQPDAYSSAERDSGPEKKRQKASSRAFRAKEDPVLPTFLLVS